METKKNEPDFVVTIKIFGSFDNEQILVKYEELNPDRLHVQYKTCFKNEDFWNFLSGLTSIKEDVQKNTCLIQFCTEDLKNKEEVKYE